MFRVAADIVHKRFPHKLRGGQNRQLFRFRVLRHLHRLHGQHEGAAFQFLLGGFRICLRLAGHQQTKGKTDVYHQRQIQPAPLLGFRVPQRRKPCLELLFVQGKAAGQHRAAALAHRLQQRVRIGGAVVVGLVLQHGSVTGGLDVAGGTALQQPDRRVVPVHRAHQHQQQLESYVMAAQMGLFMGQHVSGSRRGGTGRHQQHRTEHSRQHRPLHRGRGKDSHAFAEPARIRLGCTAQRPVPPNAVSRQVPRQHQRQTAQPQRRPPLQRAGQHRRLDGNRLRNDGLRGGPGADGNRMGELLRHRDRHGGGTPMAQNNEKRFQRGGGKHLRQPLNRHQKQQRHQKPLPAQPAKAKGFPHPAGHGQRRQHAKSQQRPLHGPADKQRLHPGGSQPVQKHIHTHLSFYICRTYLYSTLVEYNCQGLPRRFSAGQTPKIRNYFCAMRRQCGRQCAWPLRPCFAGAAPASPARQ